MFKCIFIKIKLYDYLDNSLSDIDRTKVENHLDLCNKCSQGLNQLKSILDAASRKKTLQPNNEFWYNFKIDLDRKLNEKLVTPLSLERRLSYRLRPAFSYALTLIFILVVGNYLFKNSPRYTSLRVAQDEDLVDEISALEEAGETSDLNHNEDAYIEEINLLFQLNQI